MIAHGSVEVPYVSKQITASILDPEDGCSTFRRNVEELLTDYTVPHPII
jgi:hypothetical protein